VSRESFLDSITSDHHNNASARPPRRSRKEAQRRKAVREKLERGLQRRRFWTPEMIAAEEARLREEIARVVARRAQDQDQAA
tara:strand:- start:9731 stop:9976 length:246 start_codon:yes stop_codon:yes gene_type:complete